MKPSSLVVSTFLCCGILLSGCLLPEKFNANITVNQDASYTYRYVGSAVNVFAVVEIKKLGALSAKGNAQMREVASQLSKEKHIKKANYSGDGRYELVIEGNNAAGENLNLLGILNIKRTKDGVMTIETPILDAKKLNEISSLGVKMDGDLSIKLPRNVEVISQNATSTPKFFGMFGDYSWKIGNAGQRAFMQIRLKN